MKKPIYLHFTLEEYQQRLDALRSRMEQKGVDAMLLTTPENLYYLTGQQTPGYYWFQTLIVPMDREPVFITRRIEDDAVQQMSWVEDSRPYEDFNDWIAQTRDVSYFEIELIISLTPFLQVTQTTSSPLMTQVQI